LNDFFVFQQFLLWRIFFGKFKNPEHHTANKKQTKKKKNNKKQKKIKKQNQKGKKEEKHG